VMLLRQVAIGMLGADGVWGQFASGVTVMWQMEQAGVVLVV